MTNSLVEIAENLILQDDSAGRFKCCYEACYCLSADDPIGSRALLTRQPKRKILSANLDGVGSQKVHEDGQDGLLTTNIEVRDLLKPIKQLSANGP